MANILPHSKYVADLFIHINGHSAGAYKLHGSQGKAASLVFQLVLISSINCGGKVKMKAFKMY